MEPVLPFHLVLPARGAGRRHALQRQLREAALDGRLPPGFVLPSSRRLAAATGVGRNTVVAAYDLLLAEGLLEPRRGACPRVRAGLRPRAAPVRAAAHAPDPALRARIARLDAPPRPAPTRRGFQPGIPEHRGFPHAVWRRLAARVLRRFAREPFEYPPPEGLPVLREAIARHLGFARAVAARADEIVVTHGAQQAFDLLARLLVTPGRTVVAVEDPGYPPQRAAFTAAGARIVPVAVDDQGLCVDRLPPTARVVCVTASHQSPLGATLSIARRLALLDFARRHGAVVVEDDYDGEFRFGAGPLDALRTLDRDGRVFYVGTFSKCLFPAIRQGFVAAPDWAVGALRGLKHVLDGHADAAAQAQLAAFIAEGHLARHVRRMTRVYAARRAVLLDALRGPLSRWLEPIPGEVGLHAAAWLRGDVPASRVFSLARQHLPGAHPASDYAVGRRTREALCIGYGAIEADAMRAPLQDLARALARG